MQTSTLMQPEQAGKRFYVAAEAIEEHKAEILPQRSLENV